MKRARDFIAGLGIVKVCAMTTSLARRIAACSGFLMVALGAFGAHGLSGILEKNGTTEIWETAVFYHAVHTVVMLILAQRQVVARGPFVLFLVGILIFSGTLYVLAVTNVRWLGAVTPLGGVALLAGWLWLAIAPGVHEKPVSP